MVELVSLDTLDEHIEQLHQELLVQEGSLARFKGNSPESELSRREIEILEQRLEITHRLIAGYSQIVAFLAIERDTQLRQPEHLLELQQLKAIEQQRERLTKPKFFDDGQLKWFHNRLRIWGKKHLRDFPWRHTQDPYAVLVAEIFLQQTKATRVVSTYEQFLRKYPNLKALASASVAEINKLTESLGLNFRASRLHQLAHLLLEPSYGGKIPSDETQLLQLPGVGKYTANAVRAGAFDRTAAVLDTNVARILERFFGLVGGRVKSRDKLLWEAAQEAAPQRDVKCWNWILIDFGAMVCTASRPHCQSCPLMQRCVYLAHSVEIASCSQ